MSPDFCANYQYVFKQSGSCKIILYLYLEYFTLFYKLKIIK